MFRKIHFLSAETLWHVIKYKNAKVINNNSHFYNAVTFLRYKNVSNYIGCIDRYSIHSI